MITAARRGFMRSASLRTAATIPVPRSFRLGLVTGRLTLPNADAMLSRWARMSCVGMGPRSSQHRKFFVCPLSYHQERSGRSSPAGPAMAEYKGAHPLAGYQQLMSSVN